MGRSVFLNCRVAQGAELLAARDSCQHRNFRASDVGGQTAAREAEAPVDLPVYGFAADVCDLAIDGGVAQQTNLQ